MVESFEGEALKEPALISLVSLPNRSLASSLEVVVLLLGGSKECWARKKGEERGGTEGKEGKVPPRLYACRSEKKKVVKNRVEKEETDLERMSVHVTWRVLQEELEATPPFWQGLALSLLLSSPVSQEVVERQDQPPEYLKF